MKNKLNKIDKVKNKEQKAVDKFKKKNHKSKYITSHTLKEKHKNAQTFVNVDAIDNKGIIKLRNGGFAKVYSIDAIDLSLTSNIQKEVFFNQFKYLFQIKDINIRMYKLDDKLDLNTNRDNYKKLIEKYKDNEMFSNFLCEQYNELETIELNNETITSRYYLVLMSETEAMLDHICKDFELQCYNTTPRFYIKEITNLLEIYQFLVNLYLNCSSVEQLVWCDLLELLSPFYLNELISNLKVDEEDVQIVTIKKLSPFMDELFFEKLFNIPNARCCIHVRDTLPMNEIIRRLDNNYEFLLSERTTTRKLSDATQMDIERESFQGLMSEIKNGNEKIKEVDFIMVITGSKKEREEKIKQLKILAEAYYIKLDVPRMRQMEGWQCFDINMEGFNDYHNYLPSLTLAASFPFTITNFNDSTGYKIGKDIHTGLPIMYDLFYKDTSRTSHNVAVIASTGGGKSFLLKKIIVNEIYRGNKVFIFDAEGEYKPLVNKNGGEYIDMYSSSGGIINPLQVRFLPSDSEERNDNDIDKINYDECPLAKHLGALETFLKCAFEQITESEIVVLLDMIEKLYKSFGITKNTKISVLEQFENTDYPTFTDLINYIPDYRSIITNEEQLKIVDKLEILLDRFRVGTDAMLFNGYTSVNLDSNLIAFNVQHLLGSKNKRIITTQLVNLLTYLNNIIVGNKIVNDKDKDNIQNIAIIVDEFHLYLKGADSDVILTFEQIARRIRKYHGAFIPSSQSIHDFIGDDDSVRSATAIFNNCQYQFVGTLKEDDLTTYLKLFYQHPLTDTQKEFLNRAEMGQFLLTINSKNRIRVKIEATSLELELMGEKTCIKQSES